MKDDKWVRLLAYITGLVNQQLLLQNEYLAAENRILRAQLPKRLRLTDPQRSTLAEIGKRLGRKALERPARIETLHANTVWTTNTMRDPKRIVPVKSNLNIKGERTPYVVPPYSIQLMEVELK